MNHHETTTTTGELAYDITAEDLRQSLANLEVIDELSVSRSGSSTTGFEWRMTFDSEITTSLNLFTPRWQGSGCDICTTFNSVPALNPETQLAMTSSASLGSWTEEAKLIAPDGRASDRFGASCDLSGDSIIIGAFASAAQVTTTWDFESGDLVGWQATGTAFRYQPTFGDNAYVRAPVDVDEFDVHATPSERAEIQGRYYIGTYEHRAGGKETLKP